MQACLTALSSALIAWGCICHGAAPTDWEATDLGTPAIQGSVVFGQTAVRVTAAGDDIGGTQDQCFFARRPHLGDFDYKVRVTELGNVDVWSKAALMVREAPEPSSRFAATVTTPTLAGSFFAARATNGSPALATGSFPANFPNGWLRLRRAGDQFTGYGSIDGVHWQQVGSMTMALPEALWLGLAVASHQASRATTVEFADFGITSSPLSDTGKLPGEGIGPCSRRTGLVITELMTGQQPGAPGDRSGFIELFNANPFFEDISGYRLSGSVDFTFPPGTTLPGGGLVVVAKDPAALKQACGLTNIVGPYEGSLPRTGTVRLRGRADAILLEIPYFNQAPWPVAADGTGHSLVLARPSYGEGNPLAWSHSRVKGGSPGQLEAMPSGPLENVVINEILANGTAAEDDYIELYNRSNEPVDVSGCTLTDTPNQMRFRIAAGTLLPPLAFAVFTRAQLGFGLDAGGETIYLGSPDDHRVIDAVRYGAQARNGSAGRHPDGVGGFINLGEPTPGRGNSERLQPNVVINELMFHPLSDRTDEQFVELYNRSQKVADLSGWRFRDGIEFEFAAGTLLPPGGYLVVARDAAHLRAVYPTLTEVNTVGNFTGRLSQSGERLALFRPEPVLSSNGSVTSVHEILVDELTYQTGGRWGRWADGGGSSLERTDADGDTRWPANWADSDETAKAEWTTVEVTGPLKAGSGTPDVLQLMMLAAGECLIDNVELLVDGVSTNLIANPSFDGGMPPWIALGDHIRSSSQPNGGEDGSNCLHIRASNQGDTLANHIRTSVRQPSLLEVGKQATLRARARWLCGSPEVILRLKGNSLEAFGHLPTAARPGTPGERNSRARPEAGPEIFEVTHWPVLPATNQDILVTARVEDRHGVDEVRLNYRFDPSTNYTTVPMTDDGKRGDSVAGDGIFTATLPAPGTTALAAFFIEAECAGSPIAIARSPVDAPGRECLVRFGETVPVSGFGTYRLWFTAATLKTWTSRPVLSNEELDGTFVYGNQRVVYNIGARYSGSPWHQGAYNSPVGNPCTYAFSTPGDELVLGTTSFNKLHGIGNTPGDDTTLQREQTAYWIVRQMGLPWNYQRYVQVYFNGQRRGQLMEDTQVPGGDSLQENFSNDPDGDLYKLNGWYEADSSGGGNFHLAAWCALNKSATKEPSAYRWNWAARAAHGTANNYAPVFALTDAANAQDGTSSEQVLASVADMPQWLRTFAVEHAVGNWDSFGNRNAQNMYAYKPVNDRWKLLIWDFNIVLGNSGSDGPSGDDLFQMNPADAGMRRIYRESAFARTYLQTLQEIAAGPLVNTNIDPIIDARYAAFRASGITASAPSTIKSWIKARRSYLQTYLTNSQPVFSLSGPTNSTLSSDVNSIVLSGIAPVEVAALRVNGVAYPITWTNRFEWAMTVPLKVGNNRLIVQGYDVFGRALPAINAVREVACAGGTDAPRLVINEIMHHPSIPGGEYIEILNTDERNTYDLTGCRLSGVDFDFADGQLLGPGEFAVVTGDPSAFVNAYGTRIAPVGQFKGSLNPNGETIRLIRKAAGPLAEVILDEVTYSSAAPWPAEANEPGVSVQLRDARLENNAGSNWLAISPDSIAHPEWKFVSVTGKLQSPSNLLIYHSPFQPERELFDLAGRWDGNIQFPGQLYAMTVEFYPDTNGAWSGQFTSSETSLPLVVRVTNFTNVFFNFPPNYGTVTWQGRLTPDGESLNGTFSQVVQGQTATAPFSLRRFEDPEVASGGDVYIDDLSLVAGPTAEVGPNLIRNGGFETELPGTWNVASNHFGTAINTGFKHAGNASLHLVAKRGGAGEETAVWQDMTALPAGQVYTLSYWFLPTVHGNELTVRTSDGALLSNHSIRPAKTASPGEPNPSDSSWSPLPALVLTEIQPVNTTGIKDGLGHAEPWLEIYNAGATPIALDNCYLSDNPGQLSRWGFPRGLVSQPGQYMTVWLDGAPGESVNTEPHAGFRPPPSDGLVLLTVRDSGQVRVVDALSYGTLAPGTSYGVFINADGSRTFRKFDQPTPGAINRPAPALARVRISEWLANNTRTLLNPASHKFEDWFELYNPNSTAVDLTGFFLTDDRTNPRKWQIPSGTSLEASGYLLIWADERTEANSDINGLHANFKLSQEGEFIGLFAPDGSLIDSVTFGPQLADVSEGYTLDDSAIHSFKHPTPGTVNVSEQAALVTLQINRPRPWSEQGWTLEWRSEPGRRYQIQFTEALGKPKWTNLGVPLLATELLSEFADPDQAAARVRFYRVVLVE